MSDLYSRIEKLCHVHGINISEMCRESGAPRGSLTDLKKGRTSGLTTATMSKIASYFNVSIDSLLRGDDDVGNGIYDVNNSVIAYGNIGNTNVSRGSINVAEKKADQSEDPTGQAVVLNEQELELIRVYRSVSMRKKNKIMTSAYEIEDEPN